MQTFRDSATQQVYSFEDDVVVVHEHGVYTFFCNGGTDASGNPLRGAPLTNLPATLQPYTVPAPTAAELLAQAQTKQSAILSTACAAAIQSGFTSAALGTAYGYGCNPADQANIALAAAAGGSLWCDDATGVWAYKAHTATQAQQVQKDLAAHVQGAQSHYATLLAQINAATTVKAVEAIVW